MSTPNKADIEEFAEFIETELYEVLHAPEIDRSVKAEALRLLARRIMRDKWW